MLHKKQSPILSILKFSVIQLSFFILVLGFHSVSAQNIGRSIPAVDVKTLDGRTFNTSEISNNGKPIIISFWATWCKPCVTELNNIDLLYEEWQEETGVQLIAISIDDARNLAKVAPFVNGKGWDYDVYLDPNGDLKRAMNVNMVPHTFLVNGDLQVVYQHNSYAEGDELKLYDRIKKLSQGVTITEE